MFQKPMTWQLICQRYVVTPALATTAVAELAYLLTLPTHYHYLVIIAI